jgi:hypothetical protein
VLHRSFLPCQSSCCSASSLSIFLPNKLPKACPGASIPESSTAFLLRSPA